MREPLAGTDCSVPVPLDHALPVASYQTVVRALEAMLNEVDAGELGADRTLMLPSLSAAPSELAEAAARLAASEGIAAGSVSEAAEEVASRIVRGMGSRTDGARALALGITGDESVDAIVRAYADDYYVAVRGGRAE